MTERLQEILNRKPSKWGNLTVKEFEGDIKLLQERVQELEEFNRILSSDKSMFIEELVREQHQNKRYREALEWYSENSPHGNIADEALEESD